MALASVVRWSASAVAPLAIRVTKSRRNYHRCSALFSPFKRVSLSCQLSRRSSPSVRPISSSPKTRDPDEFLLRVIDSEIKSAGEESDVHDKYGEEVPDDFPFKIKDNTGLQTVSLTRVYKGETINVEVHMPEFYENEEDVEEVNNEDGDTEKNDESSDQPGISLVVKVSKGGATCLEFGCTAYTNEIVIDSLAVEDPETKDNELAYAGPDFLDLDEKMQKAIHKYLEARGIKPSATEFLLEYMTKKDSREYLMWLNKLKKFIAA